MARTPPPSPHARTFEMLWGRRLGSGRGPRPALSRDRVVQAAVEIADTEGLDALTMGRVAARLGVTTMAIYRHVTDKEQLVDLMADAALGAPPLALGRAWRDDVAAWARAELAMLQLHPWLLATLTRRSVAGPRWAGWLDGALAALAPLDLSAGEKLALVFLLDGHARSTAELARLADGDRARADAYHAALDAASQDPRYPALAAAGRAGAFDPPGPDEPTAFEFGLARVLDGVEAYARRAVGRASHRARPRKGARRRRP